MVTARASAGAVHPVPAANISARWEALQQFESGLVTQEEQEAGSGSTILVLVLSSLALPPFPLKCFVSSSNLSPSKYRVSSQMGVSGITAMLCPNTLI